MSRDFADEDAVEETIENSDSLSEDSEIVQRLREVNEEALEAPIEAADLLQQYELYASNASADAALQTVESTINSRYTVVDPFTIKEFREYIRSYPAWGSDADDLQDQMEDDSEFSTFTTLQGEVAFVADAHESIAAKFVLDDGSDDEDDGIFVTVWDDEDHPSLDVEEGDTVLIDAFAVNLWEGQEGEVNIDVESTPVSSMIEVDSEFDVGAESEELSGVITGLRNAQDVLFKRNEGEEDEHWDLRVKAFLTTEDGEEEAIVINTDEAEEVLDMTVEEAVQEAQDDLGSAPATMAALENLVDEHISVEALHYEDNDTYAVIDLLDVGADAESRVAQAAEAAPSDD